MKLLEALYSQEIKPSSFHPRKVSIDHKKIILKGSRFCGKTTLIQDHLSRRKKGSYLYIDFFDLRVNQAIFIGLPNFIKQKNISLLVLDNFDFSFSVPKLDEVIITTQKDVKIEGFKNRSIYPLDFEEFLAFGKNRIDIESSFNDFAVCGTYPIMAQTPRERLIQGFQNLISLMIQDKIQMSIFKALSLSQGEKISPFGIYQELKVFHKISKDRLYASIKEFQERGVIFFLSHFDKPKASKKLYLVDFAIKSVLTFDKDFIKRFENIIFLELLKSGEEFYYTDMIEFYLPKKELAVIPMLFLPKPMIESKLKRISKDLSHYRIKKVEIITLEAEGEFDLGDIACEIVPFWNWALRR